MPRFSWTCEACRRRTIWFGVTPAMPFTLDCLDCGDTVTCRWMPSGASTSAQGPTASLALRVPVPSGSGPAAVGNDNMASWIDGFFDDFPSAAAIVAQGTISVPVSPRPSTSRYEPPVEAVSDDESVSSPAEAAVVVPSPSINAAPTVSAPVDLVNEVVAGESDMEGNVVPHVIF